MQSGWAVFFITMNTPLTHQEQAQAISDTFDNDYEAMREAGLVGQGPEGYYWTDFAVQVGPLLLPNTDSQNED